MAAAIGESGSPIRTSSRFHNIHESRLAEVKVTGNELKRAFRELAPRIGRDLMEIISNQLEIRFLIVMHGSTTYTLAEVANALTKTIGESAAYMIIDSLVEQLDIELE